VQPGKCCADACRAGRAAVFPMCGIVGVLTEREDLSRPTVESMVATLSHRGPDSRGVWIDAQAGCALGNTRLSILDLSSDGYQPMTSASGRYVITFNGEIYNFLELRRELEALGHSFRGGSDTEVALAAVERWGVEPAMRRFNGMFALALWDRSERVLYMARDRLGEKPLYYTVAGGIFMCASELKALRRHPAFRTELDCDALALFMRYSYIVEPYTIYRKVYKLPTGVIASVRLAGNGEPLLSAPHRYWSAQEVAENSMAAPFIGSETEALEQLEMLLRDAVRLRMLADVPVGVLFSGGMDSSMIVALMQTAGSRRVKTFSLGFSDPGYNEAPQAKLIAQHLGTEHTELYVSGRDAAAALEQMPALFDEPFADYSQVPTYLVAKLARSEVTVTLTGEGGDELFGGYERYLAIDPLWRALGWIPGRLRTTFSSLLTRVAPESWDRMLATPLNHLLPSRRQQVRLGEKLHKLAELMEAPTRDALYLGLLSHWQDPSVVLAGGGEPPSVLNNGAGPPKLADWLALKMYLDLVSYLPGDILVKVDRATMGVSLEGRMPFLDHRVVEFAWRLPMAMKIRDGVSKYLLRRLLYKYVPPKLVERPKMGFGAPVGAWLRGPMREWAEELLEDSRLRADGLLNPEPIRQKWREHLAGKRNWQYQLWTVLMFQAWRRRWL
jgi:asparagine synthase (glutamine-hydrolysing)